MGWGGGWNKDCAFILPNPKWEWAAGMRGEGGKEKLSRNSPLQGFCGVAGHRWLPSDFQLGTSGKFLLCLLVGAGQRLEEAPPP